MLMWHTMEELERKQKLEKRLVKKPKKPHEKTFWVSKREIQKGKAKGSRGTLQGRQWFF